MAKHTIEELKIKQGLPLEIKIKMSKARIREWIDYYGEEGVYVAFSGGKDSTVLLNLVREDYPNVKAVFIDTGLEYPEIKEFVKSFDNVDIVRPKMSFKQVVEKYGYPFISKEVSKTVYYARKHLKELSKEQVKTPIKGSSEIADLLNIDRRSKDNKDFESIKNGTYLEMDLVYTRAKLSGTKLGVHEKMLFGEYEHKAHGKQTGELSNMYNKSRYKFFIGAPFEISNVCCDVMKKSPVKKYAKDNGKVAITGQMAEESRLRTQKWLENGCNAFDNKRPVSNPLSFWTEQDILRYIKEYNVKICSVYGDVVIDYEDDSQFNGQMDFSDLGLMEDTRKLKTTGCTRTGCMFCGFGCHLEEESRFERMKVTHPKIYDYIMRPKEDGGLNYKAVIDWINENGNLNIRY